MTDEPDPWRDMPAAQPPVGQPDPTPDEAATDDEPVEAAVVEPAPPPRPPLDPTSQLIVGAGAAVAVLGLVGWLLGAWYFDWSGLILIAAGAIAAVAQYVAATGSSDRSGPVATRDLVLAGGTVAGILGLLFVVEILFDLDDLGAYGGILGVVATFTMGVAGVSLYVGASRLWSGGLAGPWQAALKAGDQPTRLVIIGAGLVVLGWFLDLIIGFWYLEAGSEVVTYTVLAALITRATADPDKPLRLPFPPAFIAVVLMVVSALIALQHTGRMFETSARATYLAWVAQLVYVVGVGVALAGSLLAAAAASRQMTSSAAVPITEAPASALPAAPAPTPAAPEPAASAVPPAPPELPPAGPIDPIDPPPPA